VRRDPPTLFDFIEETFDQVARTIEVRAEADGLVVIPSAGCLPKLPFSEAGPSPIGLIATVGEQHRSRLQAR
jgi:hypothetical protein